MIKYTQVQKKDSLTVFFEGNFQAISLREIEPSFSDDLKTWESLNKKIVFDLKGLTILDTAGAWLLSKTIKYLEQSHKLVEISATHDQQEQISTLMALPITPPAEDAQPIGMEKMFIATGKSAVEIAQYTVNLISFFGEMVTRLWTSIMNRDLRWVSIYHHIDVVGLRAVPIIGLISFLIGAVLAYQGINQLARFGAQIYAVDFLAVSILREIAVLITAIVIAGRSGSAFAAQIGTMALNQEIDAIRVLGLNPMAVLVLPRVVALLVSLPLLVFFSMIMGLMGGMLLSFLIIDLAPIQFWLGVKKAISPSTFWVGMSKAPLFAVVIALVGCFRGMQVKGSAESVGFMTTRSVVESIFLVIIFDALLSILFSALDL